MGLRGAVRLFPACLIFAWFAAAASSEIPPPPAYYVLDEPGVLSTPTRSALSNLLIEHDQATGEQVVIAVFASLQGEDLVARTNAVFEKWEIGRRGKDNGVLLALYWKDRKARIEVGYGLEGLLTDAKSKRVIEESLVPELRAGQPDRALSLAALGILTAIESPLIESGRAKDILRAGGLRGSFVPAAGAGGSSGWLVWVFVGAILLLIALNLLTSADAHFTGGGWYRPRPRLRYGRGRGIFWGGTGSGSFESWPRSGGGWGGGGFIGGGGRSGGGGASGSW